MVADRNMPGECRGVRHDDLVAQMAIMRDVDVGHEKIMVADRRLSSAEDGASIDGDVFAQNIIIPDLYCKCCGALPIDANG